ncbi:MAG: hypothetical protein VXW36_04810, partial [Candidatus Thermoplasmatota archaeon]|nr:hypothetical protein [Candidatus Thermoplasmatota archaeon]
MAVNLLFVAPFEVESCYDSNKYPTMVAKPTIMCLAVANTAGTRLELERVAAAPDPRPRRGAT